MKPQAQPPDSSLDSMSAVEPEPVWVPGYPWWVRVLAVLHVLSHVLGPLGFFVLMATACFLGVRRRGMDDTVLVLGALALACPAICVIFRRWFERFGQRHWPAPTESPTTDSTKPL